MAQLLDPVTVEREAYTQSIGDIARYLQDALGQQLVAYLSGVRDQKMVGRWAAGKAKPRWPAEIRLRCAYQAVRLLADAYGIDTARAWLFGTNTRLNDEAPAYLLRYAEAAEDLRFIVPAAREFAGRAA